MSSRPVIASDERRRFIDDKVRAGFYFLDVNKDGLLTTDDYRAIADYISEKTGANAEQAETTRREWVKWMKFLQPQPSVKVNVDRFVEAVAELRQDVENYGRMIRETIGDLFDRIDFDGDEKISLEELKIFYGAVGFTDEEKIKEIFREVDRDGSGYIDREEFINDLIRHFTSDDPETGRTHIIKSFQ